MPCQPHQAQSFWIWIKMALGCLCDDADDCCFVFLRMFAGTSCTRSVLIVSEISLAGCISFPLSVSLHSSVSVFLFLIVSECVFSDSMSVSVCLFPYMSMSLCLCLCLFNCLSHFPCVFLYALWQCPKII